MIKKQFLIPKGASADGTLRPMQGNALLLPTITVSFAMLLKSLFYPWKKINWNPRCTLAKKVKKKKKTAKQSVFLRIQVRASSQTESLERGWKQRARLGRGAVMLARFARVRLLRHALPNSLLILRKKPTVLQSKKKQQQQQQQQKKTRKWMWYIKAQSLRPVTGTGRFWDRLSIIPSCGHSRDNLIF